MYYKNRLKFFILLTKFAVSFTALLLISISSPAQNSSVSGVTGVVTDEKGILPGVSVTVLETKQGLVTGNSGEYTITLKPGQYTLQYKFLGYKVITKNVAIGPKELLRLNIFMSSDNRLLNTVKITGTRKASTVKELLVLRRNSSNIQDAIGSVQIDKSASITTAQALQRVTGVTIKDGKYITVRGLSDRNVVVQLNGSRLAGADAGRSSVPVDLIPAQLLENIIVEKSITPDKPGDANGAVVDINTKTIPDKQFIFVQAQTGVDGNIGLLGNANSFQGANLGFFGQNVSKQDLSADYNGLILDYTARGYSTAKGTIYNGLVTAIGQSNVDQAHYNEAIRIDRIMNNTFSPILLTQNKQFAPDQIYGVTYGNRYLLKGGKAIGLIFGANYYNRSTSNPNGQNNLYTLKEPTNSGIGSPNIVYPNELALLPIYRLNENTGNQQLNFGGLATLSFRFNDFNELSFTYSGNIGAEVTATQEDGVSNSSLKIVDPNTPPFFQNHQRLYEFILHTTQRTLASYQLRGNHKFRFIKKSRASELTYSFSQSNASQDEPDYRDTRMRVDSLGRIINPKFGINSSDLYIPSEYQRTYYAESDRYYRKLEENNQNFKYDLTIPFRVGKDSLLTFKTGAYYYGRKRNYGETLFIRFDNSPVFYNEYGGYSQVPGDLTTYGGNLNEWASSTNIGVMKNANTIQGQPLTPGYLYTPQPGITYIPGSGSNKLFINSYNANQDIIAFYGMFDLNLSSSWRLIGGLRVENTSFKSTPDTTNTGFITRTGIKDQEDFTRNYVTNYLAYNWLPSASLIYKGLKKFNFRTAFSRTLIRPELNEIVLSAQRDPIQQITVYGNKDLRNGVFSNYDFRTDWFIGDQELISFSAFYKTVVDQIERVYTNGTIDQYGFASTYVSFRNNPTQGKVYGLEFEIRKNLSQLFSFGKYLYIGANILVAKSVTNIDSVEYYVASIVDRNAPHTRPLVDQPNHAYNFNIDFDNPKWGTQVTILYNQTGKRLADINSDGSPNIYEIPAPTFDLTWSQQITKKLQFKTFIKNAFNGVTKYYYANPGGSNLYGIYNQEYIRRTFSYGSVYTLGFKYTF